MNNNKGFSILELVISFAICMVILIFMFEIVLVLRETYEKSMIKTELYNKQNLIIEQIYSDINKNGLNTVTCTSNSAILQLGNDENKGILINEDNTITYGDFSTALLNGTTVDTFDCKNNNGVISISLPITHQLFNDEDFGIKIIHFLD